MKIMCFNVFNFFSFIIFSSFFFIIILVTIIAGKLGCLYQSSQVKLFDDTFHFLLFLEFQLVALGTKLRLDIFGKTIAFLENPPISVAHHS